MVVSGAELRHRSSAYIGNRSGRACRRRKLSLFHLLALTVLLGTANCTGYIGSTGEASRPTEVDASAGGSPDGPTTPETPDGSTGGAPAAPAVGSGGTSGTTNSSRLGVFCGNDPAAVQQFEDWLGRPVDGIVGFTGMADWDDYDGSVPWAIGIWRGLDRPVFWSVPLLAKGASLDEAAAGSYDDHYRLAAQALARFRPQDSKIFIRTGWEFNDKKKPKTAKGKEDAYVG